MGRIYIDRYASSSNVVLVLQIFNYNKVVNLVEMYNIDKTNKIRTAGVSLPESVIKYIDNQRGDISRSKYILRSIEKTLPSKVSSFNKKADVKGDD